jgi:chromosomal replication initiator protein
MNDQLRLELDERTPAAEVWSRTLREAEGLIGQEAVETWLRPATVLSCEDGRLVLNAANATARTWIERKYAKALRLVLGELLGRTVEVEVVARPEARPAEPEREKAKEKESGKGKKRAALSPRPGASALFAPIPLNEKYTFENYVVGHFNRFAHAAARTVADADGRGYNPLFIYGGVGLGKTHLLQAIGHALRAREPHARVAYVQGETFTTHFITSIREHREEEFRRAYRSVDIWLVDDIQFIADKTSTKEEFFHTFNELYLTNRQIVLAGDRAPRELHLMDPRLRTRLESGLMVEISEPDLETRVAILQQRAAQEHADVPPEALFHIARTVTQNIRVLEAALIRLVALASINRCPITGDLAARALAAFVQETRQTPVNLLAIRTAVCEHFGIKEEDLTSPRRDRKICEARQVAMYLMRELSSRPLVEIGGMFGGKSHSTVLYACGKLDRELRANPALAEAVRSLRGQLASLPQSRS